VAAIYGLVNPKVGLGRSQKKRAAALLAGMAEGDERRKKGLPTVSIPTGGEKRLRRESTALRQSLCLERSQEKRKERRRGGRLGPARRRVKRVELKRLRVNANAR